MLANLSRRFDVEVLRGVYRLIIPGEFACDDHLVRSHDVDGNAAQVTALRTRLLDVQDQVGANIELPWNGLTHLYVCLMCRHECPAGEKSGRRGPQAFPPFKAASLPAMRPKTVALPRPC